MPYKIHCSAPLKRKATGFLLSIFHNTWNISAVVPDARLPVIWHTLPPEKWVRTEKAEKRKNNLTIGVSNIL